MVEFALILPIMLLLLAAAVDLGRLFYAYLAVSNAAKEGAFFGARSPLCVDDSNVACPDPLNVEWHVQNEAPNLVNSSGVSLFTTQIACRDPNGTLRQPINLCVNGDTYIVTVTYPFRLVTPILSSLMGSGLTLGSTSQATVIGDAFDPTGLELLVWVNTSNADNATEITSPPAPGTPCTPADAATSPGFYFQPCQDGNNVDHYLTFQEAATISYKVRVKNTGNINLTGLTYQFALNGTNIAKPTGCNGNALPTSLAAGAASVFCSFTLPAGSAAQQAVTLTGQGVASGVATGDSSGIAVVNTVPRPRLAVNVRAANYRLGDDGDGVSGSPSYGNADLTLIAATAGAPTEILNPTGWLLLSIVNQGGAANNLSVSLTQNGSAVTLPCSPPASLSAAGLSGNSFTCILPRTFSAAGNFDFVATATATNSVLVSGQHPNVRITMSTTCATKVIPNLVDTLAPTADGSNKTVAQASGLWTSSGMTGSFSTSPAGAPGSRTVVTQNRTAYTCGAATTTVTVGAP